MTVKIDKGTALSNLSLTPLIDVVFLLLIFFLVATRFADEDREMDVSLPSASEARPLTEVPNAIFVNITEKGEFFVGGKNVTLVEVERILRRAIDDNPLNQSVIIRADRQVPFEYPVRVMDICNRHGILDYTVQTATENGA